MGNNNKPQTVLVTGASSGFGKACAELSFLSLFRLFTLRAISVMEYDEQNGADPEQLARKLLKILQMKEAGLVYREGMLLQKLLVKLMPLLPNRLMERLLMMAYKI